MASRSLGSRVGERVTLVGTAANAKGGAVVLVDEQPVYLDGLDAWPAAVSNRMVEVTGTLRDEKVIPDPEVDGRGQRSAGAYGSQLVLESPTWRLAG